MVKENNEMDAKTKLAIISGNIQAMEVIVKNLKKIVDDAKDGVNSTDREEQRRINCALGSMMHINDSINALQSLANATFYVDGFDPRRR